MLACQRVGCRMRRLTVPGPPWWRREIALTRATRRQSSYAWSSGLAAGSPTQAAAEARARSAVTRLPTAMPRRRARSKAHCADASCNASKARKRTCVGAVSNSPAARCVTVWLRSTTTNDRMSLRNSLNRVSRCCAVRDPSLARRESTEAISVTVIKDVATGSDSHSCATHSVPTSATYRFTSALLSR